MSPPTAIGDFNVVPVVYSTQATHYLYARAHNGGKTRHAGHPALPHDRTLFLCNVPPDATERDLITLFTPRGPVERVQFGGHASHDEVDTLSDAENDDEDTEMPDDVDISDDEPVRKGKKNKKSAEKKPVPKIVALPTVPLRHLRRAGGTAHIVFNTPKGLQAALKHASDPLPWPKFKANSAAEPVGLAHYIAQHKSLRPALSAVREHADSSMEMFEYLQEQKKAKSKYKKGDAIVDEDGFTLVTRGGAYGQTLGGGVSVASKKFMADVGKNGSLLEKKRAKANKSGLYAFQLREKRIKEQIAMKKAFDQDKEKVEESRKARKFKPY